MDEDQEAQDSEQPALSADFYKELLALPACITEGRCDNCGRCEH